MKKLIYPSQILCLLFLFGTLLIKASDGHHYQPHGHARLTQRRQPEPPPPSTMVPSILFYGEREGSKDFEPVPLFIGTGHGQQKTDRPSMMTPEAKNWMYEATLRAEERERKEWKEKERLRRESEGVCEKYCWPCFWMFKK